MPRYIYRPSPFGTVFRWSAGAALLIIGLFVIQWAAVHVLPWVAVVGIVAAVFWVAARLAGRGRIR
jgi:hypothetical protein